MASVVNEIECLRSILTTPDLNSLLDEDFVVAAAELSKFIRSVVKRLTQLEQRLVADLEQFTSNGVHWGEYVPAPPLGPTPFQHGICDARPVQTGGGDPIRAAAALRAELETSDTCLAELRRRMLELEGQQEANGDAQVAHLDVLPACSVSDEIGGSSSSADPVHKGAKSGFNEVTVCQSSDTKAGTVKAAWAAPSRRKQMPVGHIPIDVVMSCSKPMGTSKPTLTSPVVELPIQSGEGAEVTPKNARAWEPEPMAEPPTAKEVPEKSQERCQSVPARVPLSILRTVSNPPSPSGATQVSRSCSFAGTTGPTSFNIPNAREGATISGKRAGSCGSLGALQPGHVPLGSLLKACKTQPVASLDMAMGVLPPMPQT